MAGKLSLKRIPSDTVSSPAINKLEAIFDSSPETLAKRPNVPQFSLERAPPPARGIPDYIERLGEKKNLDRMDNYAKVGAEMGATGWWNAQQLRDYMRAELPDGEAAFQKLVGMVAATSPQNKTPQNVKTASHYYQLDRQGTPINVGDPIPEGYGHYVQKNHQRNAQTIQSLGTLKSQANPKISSMQQNLLGNYDPLTADIHNSRALGLKTKGGKPVDTPERDHYGFIEGLQVPRAERLGMKPAEYQGNVWVGAGGDTGLASPNDPWIKVFEDRVKLTADKLGMTPQEALSRFVKGEIRLNVGTNPLGVSKTVEQNNAGQREPGNIDLNARPAKTLHDQQAAQYGGTLATLGEFDKVGANDTYQPEPVSEADVQSSMPKFSDPPKRPYAKIQLPGIFEGGADASTDYKVLGHGRVKGIPPTFGIRDDGVILDPLGDPAEVVQPPRGQIISDIANAMMPGGPAGAAIKAVAGTAHGGSTTLGVGPILQGKLTQSARTIKGKPETVKIPGEGEVAAAPIKELEQAADSYMTKAGRPGAHVIDEFPKLDEEKARRIAAAYEAMQHAPNDPAVRRAYDAMIEETMGQYRALKDVGIDFRANKPGQDPYAASPAMGYADLVKNGRLNFFPTEQGFGVSAADVSGNPLLQRVGKIGDLENATANDAFRVVHDAFGHFAPGNPFFRAPGEERAWRAHSRMYSPDAMPAMTAETRGQNSWLNFGPYAEHNKTASGADTLYADQKAGMLPPWTLAGLGGAAVLPALAGSGSGDESDREPLELTVNPSRRR